jgi:hypothetical protein
VPLAVSGGDHGDGRHRGDEQDRRGHSGDQTWRGDAGACSHSPLHVAVAHGGQGTEDHQAEQRGDPGEHEQDGAALLDGPVTEQGGDRQHAEARALPGEGRPLGLGLAAGRAHPRSTSTPTRTATTTTTAATAAAMMGISQFAGSGPPVAMAASFARQRR